MKLVVINVDGEKEELEADAEQDMVIEIELALIPYKIIRFNDKRWVSFVSILIQDMHGIQCHQN